MNAYILYGSIAVILAIAEALDWTFNFPKKYIFMHGEIVEEDNTEPLWI